MLATNCKDSHGLGLAYGESDSAGIVKRNEKQSRKKEKKKKKKQKQKLQWTSNVHDEYNDDYDDDDDDNNELWDEVKTRIAKRNLVIQAVKEQISVLGLQKPHTLVQLIEKLWTKETGSDRFEIDEKNKELVKLPNGKTMVGEFKGTLKDLESEMKHLETFLQVFIPPKSFKGSWKLTIPPFRNPGIPKAPKLESVVFEPIPKFQFSGQGLLSMPHIEECRKITTIQIDESKLPRISLPDLNIDNKRNEGSNHEAKDLRTKPYVNSNIQCSEQVQELFKKGEISSTSKIKRGIENLNDEQLAAYGKACCPITTTKSSTDKTNIKFKDGKLVDHLEIARKEVKKLNKNISIHYVAPKLKNETKYDLGTFDLEEKDGEIVKLNEKERELKLDDFMPEMEAEPLWDENEARSLICNAKDIQKMKASWKKIVEKPFEEKKSSLIKETKRQFKQFEQMPNAQRVSFPVESGCCMFSKDQHYSFIQFKRDMGSNPVIDFLWIENLGNVKSTFEAQVHDCTNQGFVLHLQAVNETHENIFKVPTEQDAENENETKEIDGMKRSLSKKSLKSSNKTSSSRQMLDIKNDSALDAWKVHWRVLHTDWAASGAVQVEMNDFLPKVTWQPSHALQNGFIMEYPMKPLIVPPLWTTEENQREIEFFVNKTKFTNMYAFEPPEFPNDKVGQLKREIKLSQKYQNYKAVILIDCSPEMLIHEMWQRAKFEVRSFLDPQNGESSRIFANGGKLLLSTLNGKDASKSFLIDDFSSKKLDEAKRWVAALETRQSSRSEENTSPWLEISEKKLLRDYDAVHVFSSRETVLESLNSNVARKYSRKCAGLHLVYFCKDSSKPNSIEHCENGRLRSIRYINTANSLPTLHQNEAACLISLDEANPYVDDGTENKNELQKALQQVMENWELETKNYKEKYDRDEEEIRRRNRQALEDSKEQQKLRQQVRKTITERTRKLAEDEHERKILWRWQMLAGLANKKEKFTALNIFLAVASSRKVVACKDLVRRVLQNKSEAEDCAIDALVYSMEKAFLHASRKKWIDHAEKVRNIRLRNAKRLQEATETYKREQERIKISKATRAKEIKELVSENTLALQHLSKKQLELVREHNENLLMGAEDDLQDRIRKAIGLHSSTHLQRMQKTAYNHQELMKDFVSNHLNRAIPRTDLKIPLESSRMLDHFLPLRSHQERVKNWSKEKHDRYHQNRIEIKKMSILRDEFILKLIKMRDTSELECEHEDHDKNDTVSDVNFNEQNRASRDMMLKQKQFEESCNEFRTKAVDLVANIENHISEIEKRGYHLLLHPSPMSKCIKTPIEKVQKEFRFSLSAIEAINLLDRIAIELDSSSLDKDLSRDVEQLAFLMTKETDMVLSDRLFTDAVNLELIRTLRARLGFAGRKVCLTRKHERDEGKVNEKQHEKRNNCDGLDSEGENFQETGRGSVKPCWKSFSNVQKMQARNLRAKKNLYLWFRVNTMFVQVRNVLSSYDGKQRLKKRTIEIEKHNKDMVEQAKMDWKVNVVDPISRRNTIREKEAQNALSNAVESLKMEAKRILEEAQVQYQTEIVEPLESFNLSVENLSLRAKAAKLELKLLTHFRENLRSRCDEIGICSDDIVPTRTLGISLDAAFERRKVAAGSGVNMAVSKSLHVRKRWR